MVLHDRRSAFRLTAALLAFPLLAGCFGWTYRASATRTDYEDYPITGDGRVELRTFNGSIDVQGGAATGVHIQRITICRSATDEEARAGLDAIVPEVLIEQAGLTVKVHEPAGHGRMYQVSLKAQVPEGSRVVLSSSNGAIRVNGVRGEIDASTSNGEVAARDGGGSFARLRTSNGKVIAERLTGAVNAHTSNGSIDVAGCRGTLDATTSNSAVRIEADALSEDISASTSSGDVTCTVPWSFRGRLEARTSNGKVRCDFPLTIESGAPGKDRLKGTIGGEGPRLKLITSNGGIQVRRGPSGEAQRPRLPAERPLSEQPLPQAPTARPADDDTRRA